MGDEGLDRGFRHGVPANGGGGGSAGAHGIVGVVDTTSHLIDNGIREFHIYGTAVVVEGAAAPASIWTTYLAGQRLAKLLEAGLMPVSVVASMASVRIWPVCVTEILLSGGYDSWGAVQPGGDIDQVADAQMDARRLARDHVKHLLVQDALHGAKMEWESTRSPRATPKSLHPSGNPGPPLQGRRSLAPARPHGDTAMTEPLEWEARRQEIRDAGRALGRPPTDRLDEGSGRRGR